MQRYEFCVLKFSGNDDDDGDHDHDDPQHKNREGIWVGTFIHKCPGSTWAYDLITHLGNKTQNR